MASKPKSGPQEMPPSGGYNPIQTARVGIRRIITPAVATGLSLAALIYGTAVFMYRTKIARRSAIEVRSAALAVFPLLVAARDREFLKQLRRNRDEEARLMEDYPGWEVGKYFDEQVYLGAPEDKLFEPCYHEYLAHTDPSKNGERYIRTLYL